MSRPAQLHLIAPAPHGVILYKLTKYIWFTPCPPFMISSPLRLHSWGMSTAGDPFSGESSPTQTGSSGNREGKVS
jgi:hypothetical protein